MTGAYHPDAVVKLMPEDCASMKQTAISKSYIISLERLYNALGLTSEHFLNWQSHYGMDSYGRSPSGEYLLPSFPIFSKVAWMHIDPVILRHFELNGLIAECNRALQGVNFGEVRQEFESIKEMAQLALTGAFYLEFGHL